MEQRNIAIGDYRYRLPPEAIAKHPLSGREQSKLLVYRQGSIDHRVFDALPSCLPANAELYFNNTKVIQARLEFHKSSGARIEIFCLEPRTPSDHEQAFESRGSCSWLCLVGNAKKWKDGPVFLQTRIDEKQVRLEAHMEERLGDSFLVRFSWPETYIFGEVIEEAGSTPIPPYLDREAGEEDRHRYQTVYSRRPGSVAAPTAGLHFTDAMLERLRAQGCRISELTLHVGAGTFVPVKQDNAREHSMHEEQVVVDLDFIRNLATGSGPRIAVGTTSTRSLESLYWLGVRTCQNGTPGASPLRFRQWENEDLPGHYSLRESMETLLGWMESLDMEKLHFSTSLMIVPGYRFRVIEGLITNFHMPGSTLLLLIAALIGEDWRRVYDAALENNYRFLSYGDSSLLLP